MSRFWHSLAWAGMFLAGGMVVLAVMAAGLILMAVTP
jgi:hypothetical protein